MDLFYIIVLSVAVVLLIVLLTYVGLQMKTSSANSSEFPPTKQSCPDKWEATQSSDKKVLCVVPKYVENSMKNVGSLFDSNGVVSEAIVAATPGYAVSSDLEMTTIDFNHRGWSSFGMNSDCKKKDWANTYNIVWDGISNYNRC